MDNVYAWRMGEAHSIATQSKAGDYIDVGWALVKALHEKGFDIVPREPINRIGVSDERRKTLNEMCGLNSTQD